MALLQLTGTAQPLANYVFSGSYLVTEALQQAMFDIADMLLYPLIAMVQGLVMVESHEVILDFTRLCSYEML